MINVTRTFLPLILIGDSQVGKSSLTLKNVDNVFNDNLLSTIGKEIIEKKVKIDGKEIKIKIHDTAGQERYKSIVVSAIRNAFGIILVYSINQRESFISLDNWLDEIKNTGINKPIIIVGNKCDLSDRKVSYEEGEAYARQHGFKFYECSAKDGTNVNEAFDDIFQQMYQRHKKEFEPREDQSDLNFTLNQSNKKKAKCC